VAVNDHEHISENIHHQLAKKNAASNHLPNLVANLPSTPSTSSRLGQTKEKP
jgi:hypothetical protein